MALCMPRVRGRERVCLTNASLSLLGGCSGSSGRRMQPARPSTQGLFGRGWADLAIGRVTQGGGGAVGVVGGGPPLVGTSTRCHHGGARAGAWGRTLGWCWFLGRDLSGRGLAYHARRPPCTTSQRMRGPPSLGSRQARPRATKQKQNKKSGGRRPPPFGRVSGAPGAAQTPKMTDFRPLQNYKKL